MKISDLTPESRKVDIVGKITSLSPTRKVNTRYGPATVASAIIEDETGQITLSLWNEDIDKVEVGNTVKVTNGYVSTFREEIQLNTGRYGKLEILEEE